MFESSKRVCFVSEKTSVLTLVGGECDVILKKSGHFFNKCEAL